MAEFETLFISGDRASQPAAAAADQKFYMVTDEDNIVERSDGIAWTQWGPSPSGGGGGLILVEKKIVTANATAVTFSSLTGNTQGAYRLRGQIVNNSGGATFWYWLPNGLTTNLSSAVSADDGGGNTTSATKLLLVRGDGTNLNDGGLLQFEIDIFANKSSDSIGFPLTYKGSATYWNTTTFRFEGHVAGIWSETSTELTSIVVNSNAADGIGDGSTLALYSYAQS